MQTLSVQVLLGLGVAFMALEIFLMTFYVIWIGLGLIVVGVISFFYSFSNGYFQLALGTLIGVILLFLFKDIVKKMLFKTTPHTKDEFLEESGIGVIKEGRVFYKGTFWDYEGTKRLPKDGTEVKVKKVIGNKVILDL